MSQNSGFSIVDDSAYLNFLRESSCQGQVSLNVEIDGKDYARLRKGKDKTIRVAPGVHRVNVRGSGGSYTPASRDIEVAAGESIDISLRCDRGTGWLAKYEISLSIKPWRGLVREGVPTSNERSVDWSKYRFDVVNTGFWTEPAGQTNSVEDNSRSSASSTRRILAENEWVRTVMIGAETANTRGFTASLGVGWATVAANAERTVTSQYSIQQGERQKVSQQVEVHIPAYTRITVIVHWKLTWRYGSVVISGPRGSTEVPFRYVHSLDFDHHTVSG